MDKRVLEAETLSSLSHATAIIGTSSRDQEAIIQTLSVSPHDTVVLDALVSSGIKDVRNFTNKLLTSPQFGDIRLGIIYTAEKLTPEAQNALLKLLEEPPERVKIILFIRTEGGMLPTVLSRCRRYRVTTVSTEPHASLDKRDTLIRFLEAEELSKQDDLSVLAKDWLVASYEQWKEQGHPKEGLDEVLRYWQFYRHLEALTSKRLILERLVLSSL